MVFLYKRYFKPKKGTTTTTITHKKSCMCSVARTKTLITTHKAIIPKIIIVGIFNISSTLLSFSTLIIPQRLSYGK